MKKEIKKPKGFQRIIFGLIMAVLAVAFVNVGISIFYSEAPKYDDYCRNVYPAMKPVREEVKCDYVQTQAEVECMNAGNTVIYGQDSKGCQTFKECSTCNKDFEKANEEYNRNVFMILAVIGFAMLVGGLFVKFFTLQVMSLVGGALNVIIGVMRNWSDKTPVFITLGLLIAIGIYIIIKMVEK